MTAVVVSDFESNLLRILHGLLGRAPIEQTAPLLAARCDRPATIGPTAAKLLEDTLAKGCVERLARAGWRRERFLRGEAAAEGRLWERSEPRELTLSFSANTIDFLMWCTATPVVGANARWQPRRGCELTLGDRLMLYITYRAARRTGCGDVLRRLPVFVAHGLCRLVYPEDFVVATDPPDMTVWVDAQSGWVLEALEGELAAELVELERRKAYMQLPETMLGIGRSQQRAYGALIAAADAAGRRDLTRPLLAAAHRLLRKPPSPRMWVQSLDCSQLRLSERVEVYRAALVLLHALETLHNWQQESLAVGYIDEGYAAAQLWKSQWERLEGDAVYRNARTVIQSLEF